MNRTKALLLIGLVLLFVACRDDFDEPTKEVTPSPVQVQVTAAATSTEEVAVEEPPTVNADEPADLTTAGGAEEVTLAAVDGLVIVSSFFPGIGAGPRPAVILLHMNGHDRTDWTPFANQLAERGYAAMAVDMRGHGETGGEKDWDKVAGDLGLVMDYLVGREDVDGARIGAAGASIGANMSLVLAAAEPAIKTAVLLSPGENYLGVTTFDRIVEYGDRPLLVVASQEDKVATVSSENLFNLARGDAGIIGYDGAGHGTDMFDAEPDLAGEILDWFDEYLLGEATPTREETTLLDIDWDNRSAFRPGLIASEAGVLMALPGATVYQMELTIAPDLYSVSGQQQVRYTNQEDAPLDEVYFHLFPNILGGQVVVSDVTLDGQPVEPIFDDVQSIMGLALASPLSPGEQTVIGMAFDVAIPSEGGSNYGVFATVDDVLALAHFYPQVAVFDDEGWNIDLPSENADPTYGDSSFYLVRVTAPAEQVIVASGVELYRQDFGGEQVLTIASGPARDFYLASSERYVVDSRTVGETTVNSYVFPEFREQNELALDVAAAALESLSSRLGPYPYTEFDLAPTPNLALGVEYPGLTVIRSALYDPEAELGQTPAMFYLESTIAHEVGHQWFYNVVGNDQIDEPWLDESLVQYMTMLYFLDVYGNQGEQGYRDSFYQRWDSIDQADIAIGQPAGAYEGAEYSAIIYGRGALFFDELAGEIGDEAMASFLRNYYQNNQWGIVSGLTIKAAAEAACTCDLSDLFAEWIGDL